VIAFQVVTGKTFLEELFGHMESKKTPDQRKELSPSTPVLSLMHRLVAATDHDIEEFLLSHVEEEEFREFNQSSILCSVDWKRLMTDRKFVDFFSSI